MTDELDGQTARDFDMTDDTIPEPIDTEGLTRVREELSNPIGRVGWDRIHGMIALIDKQAAEIATLHARIAELEAELGGGPIAPGELADYVVKLSPQSSPLLDALATPGAFIVAD